MATNKAAYVGSVFGANVPPLLVKGKFQAGSTQTVKRGEILELRRLLQRQGLSKPEYNRYDALFSF